MPRGDRPPSRAARAPLLERDLYAPVRDLLAAQGFSVRGEVNGVDLLAVRGGETVAVELKTSLNLDLVLQAVERQKVADAVYACVPRKGKAMATRRWASLLHLLQRLEVGLILVPPSTLRAEVLLEAAPFDRAKSRDAAKRKRTALLREFHGRTGDRNVGGVHRTALYTVYRQMALEIAGMLAREGPCTPRRLRELGADPDKTYGILRGNVYGWFERLGDGLYGLTDKGRTAAAE